MAGLGHSFSNKLKLSLDKIDIKLVEVREYFKFLFFICYLISKMPPAILLKALFT